MCVFLRFLANTPIPTGVRLYSARERVTPTKNGYIKIVSRRFNENYPPQLRIDNAAKQLYSFRATETPA